MSHLSGRGLRRTAVALGMGAALSGASAALAATPIGDGHYRGSASNGGAVDEQVVSEGARVRWTVSYGRTRSCRPSGFVSGSGRTFDRRAGARVRRDGRYREAVSTSEPVRFNGRPGYRVRVQGSFSGRFVNIVTARGRLDQRATFFRPDGSVLAACVRHITYTATLP